jgi:hypothetical protein
MTQVEIALWSRFRGGVFFFCLPTGQLTKLSVLGGCGVLSQSGQDTGYACLGCFWLSLGS